MPDVNKAERDRAISGFMEVTSARIPEIEDFHAVRVKAPQGNYTPVQTPSPAAVIARRNALRHVLQLDPTTQGDAELLATGDWQDEVGPTGLSHGGSEYQLAQVRLWHDRFRRALALTGDPMRACQLAGGAA